MEGKSNCQKVFFDDNAVNVCRTYFFFFFLIRTNNNLLGERLTRFAIAKPLSQYMTKKPLLWQAFLNGSLSIILRKFSVFELFELCDSVKENFDEKTQCKKQKFPTSLSLHQALLYSIYSFTILYIFSRHFFVRHQSMVNFYLMTKMLLDKIFLLIEFLSF